MSGHSVVFGQLVQKLVYCWLLQNRLQQDKGYFILKSVFLFTKIHVMDDAEAAEKTCLSIQSQHSA